MGTPEQKAFREAMAAKKQAAWDAGVGGQWTSDDQLNDYLMAHGSKSHSPLWNELNSKGGYSIWGPSWDPGFKFDFNAGEKIPWQTDPGQTWYDPSVASNWQKVDPTQMARINGFYNWADINNQQAESQYGGNRWLMWARQRAASAHPNSPDTAGWTGQNWGNPTGQGYRLGSLPTAPPTQPQPIPTPTPSSQGLTLGALTPAPIDTTKRHWPLDEYSPFG